LGGCRVEGVNVANATPRRIIVIVLTTPLSSPHHRPRRTIVLAAPLSSPHHRLRHTIVVIILTTPLSFSS